MVNVTVKGNKSQCVKAGDLSLILDDINSIGINQEKAVPTLDVVGENFDPYHFTLENLSDTPSEYTIYLDDLVLEEEEERMEDEYLRYSLVKDEVKTTNALTLIGSHPNRVLDTGTIEGGEKFTYDLRLWMDIGAGNEAMGKVFRSKIRIVAVQQEVVKGNPNILQVFQYDSNTCLTGEESGCVELTERPETYEAGTIIKYKVNDTLEKYFHVMFDEGDTLVMQQRENTIHETMWYNTGTTTGNNTRGPLTLLPILENETNNWTNVLDQTYTMGTTVFKDNAFTGCYKNDTTKEIICASNKYTLPARTSKARMITAQEASRLGCKYAVSRSCPVWMHNYLKNAINYGGTSGGIDYSYWTLTTYANDTTNALCVNDNGDVTNGSTVSTIRGARAVVIIDK